VSDNLYSSDSKHVKSRFLKMNHEQAELYQIIEKIFRMLQ
jgi:hypothetical protein